MTAYTAYDLDSLGADWNPAAGVWQPTHDIAYFPWWEEAGGHGLRGRGDPRHTASLPGSGPWRRADCVQAPYGQPSARPVGDRLAKGRGICVLTSARRYALLVVGSDERQLTVEVTVWE